MTVQNSSHPNFDFYLSIIKDKAYWLSLVVVGFILAAAIIIGNSILLFVSYKDPRKSLRSPPSFLIANLSAADLLLGLFNVSLMVLRDLYRYKQLPVPFYGELVKPVMYTVFITTLFVSSNTIIAMSTSCYVAINKPMEYKTIITKRRIKIYIVVLWVISILTCILPVTNVPEETYTMIYLHTHATVPAILLTVIYVRVFRALARRTRELQFGGFDSMTSKVLEHQRKMTIAILIILALFYITYMPRYITIHLQYYCKSCQESLTFHKIDVALSRFLYISSAINPFVYAWRVPRYRQAFVDCWKMFREKLPFTSHNRDRAQTDPNELTSV